MTTSRIRLGDGYLAGDLREQPHRPGHDVVQVDGALQEGLDRPPLRRRQGLDRGQPVHEQPVPLVGRDPPGAGVRLRDQALFLQGRHVVADRGRRNPQPVPLDQGPRPDRLLGGDVVLDDGAQHRQPAVVAHRHLRAARSAGPVAGSGTRPA
jgi:hypothetical protein